MAGLKCQLGRRCWHTVDKHVKVSATSHGVAWIEVTDAARRIARMFTLLLAAAVGLWLCPGGFPGCTGLLPGTLPQAVRETGVCSRLHTTTNGGPRMPRGHKWCIHVQGKWLVGVHDVMQSRERYSRTGM